jgi:ABC-type transport system substrate-binding protein
MMSLRRATVAALAVGTALAVGAPAAGASTVSPAPLPAPAGSAPAAWTPAALASLGGAPQNIGPAGGNSALSQGPCGTPTGAEGMGGTAGTENKACILQGGLSFIGPSIGQVASVVGPTIIGPAFVRTSIVSAGNGNGG